MLLALGFAFAGCATDTDGGEPYDGPKSIKITGYDTSSQGTGAQEITLFTESQGINNWPPSATAYGKPNGQIFILVLTVWDSDWDNPNYPYTDTGKFFVVIEGSPKDPGRDGGKYAYSVDGTNPALVDIKDAVTTLEWSKFIWHSDYTAG
jgi:hypothetical protein